VNTELLIPLLTVGGTLLLVVKDYSATWNLRTKRTRWNWQSTAWSEPERLLRRWTSNNDIADCRDTRGSCFASKV
jgi:hypothetical protein